jgi:signal transduction histidine kinase
MKIGIREKLLLGLSGMLVILAAISFVTIRQIDVLGKSLAIVLKENYQSVVACKDVRSGIGLGLSIVKELVEAQGGMVSSQSQSGKGSLFSFTLPVHKGVATGELLVNGRA